MPEAETAQTLETILPRLVSDERVRSALAERFGSRSVDVRERIETGDVLSEDDRDAVVETIRDTLIDLGEIELTLPAEAAEDEFYGEANVIVHIMTFHGVYWIDAPEFEDHDAYFDKFEAAERYAEQQYGHMLDASADD